MPDRSFEMRADSLLRLFDADRDRKRPHERPFVIELFGTPKAGKTTIKEMLKHFFKRNGWSVSTPTEGAEVVEWIKRHEPDYNFQTGEYALSRTRELCLGPLHKCFHVVILDRAIFDVIARMEYYLAQGTISTEQRQKVEGYFLLPFNRQLFDCHVCMVAAPEVAICRELTRVLTKKPGETMNPQTLQDLFDAHRNMWIRLGCADDPKMSWHDSSQETPDVTATAVLEQVMVSFEARLATSGRSG